MDFDFGSIFGGAGETFFGAIERFATNANHFLSDAFSASNVDDSWWAAVLGAGSEQGMLSIWMTVLAPIIVLLVILQVSIAMFRGSSIGMVRAAAGAFFAMPGTYVMVWIVKMATAASDEIASWIIKQGGDQTMATFMKIFGMQVTDGKLTGVNKSYWMWDGVMDKSGGWVLVVPLILVFIIWLLSLLLNFMMSLRAMGLIILASMAGWAVVSTATEVTKSWFGAWMKMVVGLLLAKPFAAALLVLSASVFNYADSGSQFAAGLVGLVLSICMPLAAISFVAFTPTSSISGMDRSLAQGASAPGRTATRGAQGISRLRRKF